MNKKMKICKICKIKKPVNEFYRYARSKDRLQYSCKQCNRERMKNYYRTEKGKQAIKKYRQTDNGKQVVKNALKKYFQTEKGKRAIAKAESKESRKEKKRKAVKKWHENKKNKQKWQAENAVHRAVMLGKIPKVRTLSCSCGSPARVYHHYRGYKPNHWFDIIPKCYSCHKKLHLTPITLT